MVRESVHYLKEAGKEVMLDLEHFFDGYKANAEYTKQVCAMPREHVTLEVIIVLQIKGPSPPKETCRICSNTESGPWRSRVV